MNFFVYDVRFEKQTASLNGKTGTGASAGMSSGKDQISK
jgi:hypothetical protein